MNEKTRREAERALLVQRFQLQFVYGSLRTLEGQVAILESESARQVSDLSRLDAQIDQLYVQAGCTRLDPSELAATETEGHQKPSSQGTRPVRRRSTQLQRKVALVDVGEDWDAYVRNTERYFSDHEIEVTGDPLKQLVPPELAVEVLRRFDSQFSPAPWDRWDYGVVALAVLVGALTDYLLVATPGGSFKGERLPGSPMTEWMKEQSKKLAPMQSPDGVERNAFQKCIAQLTTAAEDWAKVPFDVVKPKVGLTPNVHRLASPGHDPLLGLVVGLGDIVSGTCTFIDKSGAWQVIDHPNHSGTRNPIGALVKVVVHGFSDVFTAKGLPPPFLAPFQTIGAKSGFTLRNGGDPVSVRDVVRYMYANGYDLRHFMTTSISPAVAEVILWAYHGVRACAGGPEPEEPGIAERLKREQMLALTHGLLASTNILKTALYGWNPMAINLAQFGPSRGGCCPWSSSPPRRTDRFSKRSTTAGRLCSARRKNKHFMLKMETGRARRLRRQLPTPRALRKGADVEAVGRER